MQSGSYFNFKTIIQFLIRFKIRGEIKQIRGDITNLYALLSEILLCKDNSANFIVTPQPNLSSAHNNDYI